MPFFLGIFRFFNLVRMLRAGLPTEPALDMGTLRRVQRFTNLQELVEVPIQAYIASPSSSMSDVSLVSSIASDSDGKSRATDSDSDSDADTQSENDVPLYMSTRTHCAGKSRVAIKAGFLKRNPKHIDLTKLKVEGKSAVAEDEDEDDRDSGILVFASTRQRFVTA